MKRFKDLVLQSEKINESETFLNKIERYLKNVGFTTKNSEIENGKEFEFKSSSEMKEAIEDLKSVGAFSENKNVTITDDGHKSIIVTIK